MGAIAAALALGAAALVGVVRKRPEDPTTQDRTQEPKGGGRQVAIGGCSAMGEDAQCEATVGQTLAFWLSTFDATSAPEVTLEHAGERRRLAARRIAGGYQYRFAVSAVPGEVTLQIGSSFWAGPSPKFGLQVTRPTQWPWQPKLAAVGAAERKRLALALLPKLSSPHERSALLYELAWARSALGEGSEAVDAATQAAESAEASGRSSEARRYWAYVAYLEGLAHVFDKAELALERATQVRDPLPGVVDSSARALLHYTRAVRFGELGAMRRAARSYQQANKWAERAGDRGLQRRTRVGQAFVLQQQGRTPSAIAQLRQVLEETRTEGDACLRARTLSNLGWMELEQAQHPGKKAAFWLAAADRHLQKSTHLYGRECRLAPAQHVAHTRLNLGWVALQQGDVPAARRTVEQLTQREGENSLRDQPRLSLWRDLLSAEVQRRSGRTQRSLDAYQAIERFARQRLTPSLQWQAAAGAARCWVELHDLPAAVVAYRRAEQLLDEALVQVPTQSSQLRFASRYGATARELLSVLVELGNSTQAMDAARRARRRALLRLTRWTEAAPPERLQEHDRLRQRFAQERRAADAALDALRSTPGDELEQAEAQAQRHRRRARRAFEDLMALERHAPVPRSEALPEPDSGTALLTWFETDEGWHGFVRFDAKVTHIHRRHKPEGAGWIAPFEKTLTRARKLRVLEAGAFRGIDLHALTLDGQRVLERWSVEYSLDLPARAEPLQTAADGSQRFLVAVDGRGDLPAALAEGQAVTARLRQAGAQVALLSGARLSAPKLQAALRDVEFFHFAGHARFAGPEGWDSSIRLARGRLSVGEIVSWERVPPWVVLNACQASASPEIAFGAGVGIAQAFVLAGSRAVVAPLRPVQDTIARQLAEALTPRLASGLGLAEAYRTTLIQAGAAGESLWGYRLVVP